MTCSACVRTSALLALAAAVLLPGAAAAHGAGGRTIAFVGEPAAQERGLYVGARGFDKGRALVAPGGAWAAHPSWSRSHTLVVFARGGDLFAASTGGGPVRRLTRTAAAEAWPTWGRDGRIVFQRGRDVLSMRGDGTQVRLVAHLRACLAQPALSPDGRTLALVEGCGRQRAVSLLDVRSGRLRRVATVALGALPHASPAWSPDGKRLAFLAGKRSVRVTGPAASLAVPSDLDEGLAWSPDGRQLLVSLVIRATECEAHPGFLRQLFAVAVAGGAPQRARDSCRNELDADW